MANIFTIDDKPWEMLTEQEKNDKWMKEYGKPYVEPTEAERQKFYEENKEFLEKYK